MCGRAAACACRLCVREWVRVDVRVCARVWMVVGFCVGVRVCGCVGVPGDCVGVSVGVRLWA